MNLKQWLKFEKEIYFLKYLIARPLEYLGDKLWKVVSNLGLWLWLELALLVFLLWRTTIIAFISSFKFDSKVRVLLIVMFLTYLFKVFLSQEFQERYRQDKEKKING